MFDDLDVPEGGFEVIYADPAWNFITWSEKGASRGPEQMGHYDTMSLADIKSMPVQSISAPRSVLLLWAIDSMLKQALEVGEAWGFQYKTVGFYWAKNGTTRRYGDDLNQFFPYGLGHWTRTNPEQCLLFTRGKPSRRSKSVPKLVVSPRRDHSRKPDIFRKHIEDLCMGETRVELFSRHDRPGWQHWGNESGKFSETAE